ANLDGKALHFACTKRVHQIADSLRCDFVFQAPWAPRPGERHEFTFREANFELEEGLVRLSLYRKLPVVILSKLEPSKSLNALTPGHGKTLVAAYLVGERGTVWHACVLGLVTTLTHTGAVLILAVALRHYFPDTVPADVQTALGIGGGLLVAGLGFWLLMRR